MRFWKVPVQSVGEVLLQNVANIWRGCGWFQCRRYRIGAEGSSGAKGSGADIEVRFWKVPVQKVLAQKVSV